MILRLKIKPVNKSNKKQIFAWVQDHKDFREEVKQILAFFKDQITVKKRLRFHKYLKVTSENPVIMLSLLSAIQDIIPEKLSIPPENKQTFLHLLNSKSLSLLNLEYSVST